MNYYGIKTTWCKLLLFSLFLFSCSHNLFAEFTQISNGFSGYVTYFDYDNDGDLDILNSGDDGIYTFSIIYNNTNGVYSDTGIRLDSVYHPYQGLITGINGPAICGDVDNDGDLDVIITGEVHGWGYRSKESCLFRNNGSSFIYDGYAWFNNNYYCENSSIALCDIDNDGDLDVIKSGSGANMIPMMESTVIYQNNNGIFAEYSRLDDINSYLDCGDFDNDGDMDIAISGESYYTDEYGDHINAISKIYRNDNGTFIDVEAGLNTVERNDVEWGDYDNDGLLDLIMTCYSGTSLYHNNGNSNFTLVNAGLSSVSAYSVAWGDYDCDGLIDILFGNYSEAKIYHNNGNGTFTFVNAGLAANSINATWGNYDNDGDVDIFLGNAIVFRNDNITNNPPSSPSLSYNPQTSTFNACGSIDDTTPLGGIGYALRIGTVSDGVDYLSPMADLITGNRRIKSHGKKELGSYELKPQQTYYASAQAIDNSFVGSFFSPEISFTTPSLQIIYPNGGESLVSGRTSYIRWAINTVKYLKLKFSTDDGQNWVNVTAAQVPSSPGFYYYTVPIANSTQCRMRILWAKDSVYYDDSDQVFTVSSNSSEPTIAVTYPTASSINVTPGQAINITWTGTNLSSVSIDYTTNNGLSWNTIVQNRPVALSPYSWTIPDSLTSQARIRVRKADNANYYDISDNPFTICKVTVLSPNGGEVLTGDYSGVATVPINWTAPYVGTVNLYYSTNNGTNWTSITSVAGSLGTYNWTLPAVEFTTCRVKVSHSSASFISDISNAVFTLRVPVKFVNVNGGGFVNNNCNYTLRWKNIDIAPATQVHLEYSTNISGWTRANATAIPVTSLSHTVFLNLGTATQVWFRMAETGTNRIIAKSATSMTVTGKTLHISTPAIGEGLAVDSYTTITWTADGCTNLNIDYTTDFGVTWTQIGTNVPSAQGSFVWLVPNTTSTQCRIRLRDTTYSYMNIESDGEFTIMAITLIASFYGAPTSGVSDLVVSFHDQSIGYISSWAWDFDNNGTTDSNLQNPTWTYRKAGFYSVKLTVWDGPTSVTMTRNNYIYVMPMVADFLASDTGGYVPFTTQFTDMTPSDITDWQWDFDNDGVTDSEAQNPFWTYLFPGTYTVKQTVSNGYDTDIETKTGYITVTLNPTLTHYVPSQYSTIQAAIDHCVDGDYIIVSDGTYYENIVIEGKSITIASNYLVDSDSTHIGNTIIDGGQSDNPDEGSVITMLPGTSRTEPTPYVIGFTIKNGTGRRILQNIGGNTVEKRVGGGVYIKQSNPVFIRNHVVDNEAEDEGGGSYAFQSIPNLGGLVNVGVGIVNPGGNKFLRNHSDIGNDIYIYVSISREAIQLNNCSFEVFSSADTTLSNYWANSASPLSFAGSSGLKDVISSDIYVSTDGSDNNTGLSTGSPFKTVDYALSRAFGTDENPITIHIAPGTYSPSLTGEKYPLQMVKYVSLQGSGQDETYLDAEATVESPKRVIAMDRCTGVNISDLTVMGGFVTLSKNYNGGGIGILDSDLTAEHLQIVNNSAAGDGAGIYANNSTVTIDSTKIEGNSTLGSGGGLCSIATNLSFQNGYISNNSSSKNGAGVFIDNGIIELKGCEIISNNATGIQSKGGGICLSTTSNALIEANKIKSNNADNGAGIYLQSNTSIKLKRNDISNNLADYNGGGIYTITTTGNLTNNLIANNTATQRGGGIYTYSSPTQINNTIANNRATLQGGGIYINNCSPASENTIWWGNTAGNTNGGNQVYLYNNSSAPDFSYCDIQGGSNAFGLSSGTTMHVIYANNIDSNPLFTNPTGWTGMNHETYTADYSITDTSPCVDTGDPDTETTNFPFDLIGNPRKDNNLIDMGAYELIHYFGARVEANPASIDFGRININSSEATRQIVITNTGNLPLRISNIAFEYSNTSFDWTYNHLNEDIEPGLTDTIEVSFNPSNVGNNTNTLLISNNSLNHIILNVELKGTGIDACTSTPGNARLSIFGNDVYLSWNPVLSDSLGNPFSPGGYIVLYSENADSNSDNYFYLSFVEDTLFVHTRVAEYRTKMFYKIVAVDAATRLYIRQFDNSLLRNEKIIWKIIKSAIMTKKFKQDLEF